MKFRVPRRSMLWLFSIALCVFGVARLGTHAQSQDQAAASVAKQFVGTWRLVSWPERLADGTSRQNPESVAYLIYTDAGRMCFVAMDPNRPKWKSTTAPTPEEMASGLGGGGFGAYCGAFEIHAKEGYVLHQVEIEKSPNLVGTTRKRWFSFDGPNRLSLRIDSPAPPLIDSTLIWERVQK